MKRKELPVLIGTIIIWVFLASIPLKTEALTVYLKSDVLVHNDIIYLGDIVDSFVFEDTHYKGLDELRIGYAPTPNRSRQISKEYIEAVLREKVAPNEKIHIYPERITVKRYGFILKADLLKQKFVEQVRKDYPVSDYTITRVADFRDIVLPDSNYNILIHRVNPVESAPGLNLYLIRITLANKKYREFTKSVRIGQITRVFVLEAPLQKGESIPIKRLKPKEIVTYTNNFDYIGDTAYLQNKVAKRYIPANTPLQKDMVEEVPVIRRGDIVKYAINRENFRIWTKARALEDGHIGEVIWIETLRDKKRHRAVVLSKEQVSAEH